MIEFYPKSTLLIINNTEIKARLVELINFILIFVKIRQSIILVIMYDQVLSMYVVTSAGHDAWKVWYGASLLDYTKLKKEIEPYVARGLIYTVAGGSITQRGAYIWRAVAPQG